MKHLLLFITVFTTLTLQATEKKQPMTFEQIVGWERITEQIISDNGEWIACKMEPWRGDNRVLVYNKTGRQVNEIIGGSNSTFSASSAYLLVRQSPLLHITEELKLKKTKKEDMPGDKLLIYNLKENRTEEIDSIKTYKQAKTGDWLAYQRSLKGDSTLYIRAWDRIETTTTVPNVTEYGFAQKENILYYITAEKTEEGETTHKISIFSPEKGTSVLYEGKGSFKQITISEKGNKIAFLYSPEKEMANDNYSLFLSINRQPAQPVTTRTDEGIPDGWIISSHGTLSFSANEERLYFSTAPEPLRKDTTILDENRPNVQIWKWNEGVQYTQQSVNKTKELNHSYPAVLNLTSKTIRQLATEELPELIKTEEGNSNLALLATSQPYDTQRMWRGKNKYDIYLVNLDNGIKEQLKTNIYDLPKLSPEGKYAWWYNIADSSWYTFNLIEKKEYRLTNPVNFTAWNEENDVPDYPRPYGAAGWSKEDKYLLLYDRNDIWQFDPQNLSAPVNLTMNGKQQQIRYQYVVLDKEEKTIDLNKQQMLQGFDEKSKGYGYYTTIFSKTSQPKELLKGDFMLRTLVKAKKADKVIYTRETFRQYPDLYLSDTRFTKSTQLTEGYKQQEGIKWGKAELINWISLDGQKLEGVIYKPEDFDPTKKYPMIVNFYERNSETLHNYRMPEAHRSTIDYHLYNSNDYIIFNPDIRYKEGYPGESCYNCVMPGISYILQQGYVDEKAIGAQGHSWGGYQVAYLATRTQLFAAIESGAPVVNMFSAYGGIRWETGLNRSFQYEHGQSRIGKTIWEAPLAYQENSPLFTMDKVTTPILILHNDNDGHVPWYQGIEYFVALKRLQKPVWMLNYPGEVHWPLRLANKIDFQKRMLQFFNHFLKGEPMPKWMDEGIPAVMQDFDLGY